MISHLILDSTPQEKLVENLVFQAQQVKGIKQIIQRGSFANGGSDRASDVDMLLVVDDEHIGTLLNRLDGFVADCCDLIYPTAWIDAIVPDFGGIGFVYMGRSERRLVQLDLYVTPASWAKRINEFGEKKVLFSSSHKIAFSKKAETKELIAEKIKSRDIETEVIFEFLLVTLILAKQIFRSRTTLVVKYRYASIESLARLIRLIFTPDRLGYMMYDWSKDLDRFNSPYVKAFERSIARIDAYSTHELYESIRLFKSLLFESRLKHRLKDFLPLISAIEEYIAMLLTPDYSPEC